MMAQKKVATAQQQDFTKAINACQQLLLKHITHQVRSHDDALKRALKFCTILISKEAKNE